LRCRTAQAPHTAPRRAAHARLPPASRRSRAYASLRVVSAAASGASPSSGAIIVIKAASEADVSRLGCRAWPTWGCGVSTFPWSYGETETSLLISGSVTVTPTSPNGGPPVTLQAGDLATFPAGLACTWEVTAPLRKHYRFEA
jgi:hypothetical protein